METQLQKKSNLRSFIVLIICFYIVWTFRALGPVPHFIQGLHLDSVRLSLLSLVIKFLIWVVPVFCYLKKVERVNPSDYLKLTMGWQRGVFWGILIGLGQILIYFWLNQWLGAKPLNFRLGVSGWVNGIILVGFLEETLFRGLILRKLTEFLGFWRANTFTAILFLFIHLPGWIAAKSLTGLLLPISVLILGFLFGLVLQYTKSLWACIIVHSINNFVAMAISPFR